MGTKARMKQATTPQRPTTWGYLLAFSAALLLLFEVYGPAIRGPFVFDDLFLPYTKPFAASLPLLAWIGVRPILGLSFWADFQLWGQHTMPYHVMNVLLHFASSILLFFILRKLLFSGGTAEPLRGILASFGAGLFLFHPIQTEVVAYIASRSEALSVMLFMAAMCAFLYRPTAAIDWKFTALVLLLFGLSIGSKEHTVTLPALLLLTDYFWNPGFSFSGVRANVRLYLPILIASALGVAFVYHYVSADPMIGFHIQGLSPTTYFLTECRAVFEYLKMFLLPVSQNVDYDYPLSRNLTEHGAFAALAALILLAVIAIRFRKKYPFAAYGFFTFLLLLSPTSSIIPIHDVLVERRLYLPFLGLVLILFEPLRRVRVSPVWLGCILALICSAAAYATWQRAHVWGDVTALFRDAAEKSPGKARAHVGYGNALYHHGRCREALDEYAAAAKLETADFTLYFNLAAAYDCLHDQDSAIRMVNHSLALKPQASAYALLGKVLGTQGKLEESLSSLQEAIALNPQSASAYSYRGAVYAALGKPQLAYDDFQNCLRLDPINEAALAGMAQITRQH